MAYTEHILVTLSGTLGANEIWSCGMRFKNLTDPGAPTIPDSAGLDVMVEDCWPDVADVWDNAGSGIPGNVGLQFLKINVIEPDGKYRDPVTHLHEWKPPVPAGGAAQTPDFTTTCISLLTGFNRGRAHRGRVYWPNFGLPLSSVVPSKVDASARNGALNWMLSLIGALSPVGDLIVASGLDGTIRKVTRLECGDILDVQRRRKNHEPETYVGVDLPA